MINFNVQELRTSWSELPKQGEYQRIKRILTWGFLAGVVLFFVYGGEIAADTNLLNQDALKEIRDCSMEKKEFFEYVLTKRILIFGVGGLIWWCGFGKVYLYTVLTICSFTMGAFVWGSLYRYPFTGIFLWFFLFFPHMIFYLAAIICGIMLKSSINRSSEEKLQYLWKNIWKVILLVLLYIMGIYCESYLNVSQLQKFLEVF